MARPRHEPNAFHRRQVEAMAAYGVPEKDIARVVGIDAKTLRKHYREELDTGQIKATAKVAESLFRKATTEGPQSVTAAIFWLKTRAGWKETQVQELSAKSDSIITIKHVIVDPPVRLQSPDLTTPSRVSSADRENPSRRLGVEPAGDRITAVQDAVSLPHC